MSLNVDCPHRSSRPNRLLSRLGSAALLLIIAAVLGGCSSRSYFVYRDSHRHGWHRYHHCEERHYYYHGHHGHHGRGGHHSRW